MAGLIGYLAITRASFWLYLVATFFGGLYAASHMSYRFGAADTASKDFKPKACRMGERAVSPRSSGRNS